VEDLIPRLQSTGARLAAESIEDHDDVRLAQSIEERLKALEKWREVYRDEFIPFAHGVRRLGTYYNDAVRPEDPYEFLGLVRGVDMLATQRNRRLCQLASRARQSPELMQALRSIAMPGAEDDSGTRRTGGKRTVTPAGDARFWRDFDGLRTNFMNVAFGDERLEERIDLIAGTVLELAGSDASLTGDTESRQAGENETFRAEQRLLAAVGPERRDEALEFIRLGRLSWRLRDDDNLLMGRLTSQLIRALNIGVQRLRAASRLPAGGPAKETWAGVVSQALRNPGAAVALPEEAAPRKEKRDGSEPGVSPRQMVGQPAAPGMAAGTARIVRSPADLGRFKAGEVLVCDAIQPTMTHLLPLAAAVVERRGGMLIHGAIIARELGIPCVNGVQGAADRVADGVLLTVDGNLGIVAVGAPEFELELADGQS
jgi:pyruvate,water dikinase